MNVCDMQNLRIKLRATLTTSIAEQRRASWLATTGQRLAHVRDCSGESQAVWAARLEVSICTWRRYEHGANEPDARVLRALHVLGINPTWLLTGTGAVLADDESSSLTRANGWGSAGECPASFSAKTPAAGARCYRVAGVATWHDGGMVSLCVSLQRPGGGVE